MKCWALLLPLTVSVLLTAGMAQSSRVNAKSDDPQAAAATKPLTPKSASAQPHRSSAAAAKIGDRKTTAELNRLERQNIKPATSHDSGPLRNNNSGMKARGATAGRSSDINFAYRQPKTAKGSNAGAAKGTSMARSKRR